MVALSVYQEKVKWVLNWKMNDKMKYDKIFYTLQIFNVKKHLQKLKEECRTIFLQPI